MFPGFPGIPEEYVDPARVVAFLAEAQAHPDDVVVQLHGDGTAINEFACLLGGRTTVGFVPPGTVMGRGTPEGIWIPYPMHGSEIHRLLALPAALGAPTDDRLEFPVTDVDADGAERLVRGAILGRPFAIVHPGSSTPARRWPSQRFATVADQLVRAGLAVGITGTERDRPLAEAVLRAMTEAATSVAGRTTLGELAALVERAQILVANDTGVSHLAAAVGTPSVIVFNRSEIERWAPLDRDRHIPVHSDRPGMPASVDAVAAAATGLLERAAPRAARSASAVS